MQPDLACYDLALSLADSIPSDVMIECENKEAWLSFKDAKGATRTVLLRSYFDPKTKPKERN
jgi:hypothetical protein